LWFIEALAAKFTGVLYDQETEILHLMRVNLIIVSR